MTDTTPTMTVKQKADGRVRIIDKSAFNAELHEAVDGSKAAAASTPATGQEFDRKGAQATLKAAGVAFANNASNEKLQELLATLAPKKSTFTVKEVDGKFVIVDAEDKQQGTDVYDTAEDADTMLQLLTGN